MMPRSCPLCGLGPCRRGFPAYKQPEEGSAMDYYNGFDANARAEKNKPGAERALEVLKARRVAAYYTEDDPREVGLVDAEMALGEELTRINYLIAEMGEEVAATD